MTTPADVRTEAKRLVREGQYASYQDAITALTGGATQGTKADTDTDAGTPAAEGAELVAALDVASPSDLGDYEDNPTGDPDITARNKARLAAAAAEPGAITLADAPDEPQAEAPAAPGWPEHPCPTCGTTGFKNARAFSAHQSRTGHYGGITSAQAQTQGQADPAPVNDQADTQEIATMADTTTATPTTVAEGDKQCRTCGDVHPATTEFFRAYKPAPDGLWHQCKDCSNAYQATWNAGKRVAALTADSTQEQVDKATAAKAEADTAWEARKAQGAGRIAKPVRAAKATGPAVDATAQQAAELAALEAAVAAAGGEGTDEGQRLLAEAAAKAKAARARTPRAPKPAAAQAKATPAPKPSQRAKKGKAAA